MLNVPRSFVRERSGSLRVLRRLLASSALATLSAACTSQIVDGQQITPGGELGGTAQGGTSATLGGSPGASGAPAASGGLGASGSSGLAGNSGVGGSSGLAGSSGTGGTSGLAGNSGTGGLPSLVLDSGSAVLRRLNRNEYNNTVHDLLGTSQRPADKLPGDGAVDGFDTVGEGLTVSLQHMEPLEQAATQLIDELYALPQSDTRRTAVLVCQLKQGSEGDCMRQVLTGFARRAFRRPVSDAEVTRLLSLVNKIRTAGGSYEDGLKGALSAILLSPHFLYMVEKGTRGAAGVALLNSHELATRLSYFFWSSMPDSGLFAAADAGALSSDTAKLLAEAERMLEDPKAAALTDNFVGQWLTLRRLALVEPDKKTFPSYDVTLRDAAVQETESFFSALLRENSPVEALLTANFTFVNQRLGQHYGTPVSGADFQRVDLSSTQRVGLLTQASFLMANAHPAFTSPTKRGAWVLEQLLCSPPPPVPTDLMIDPLSAPAAGETLRQKLEKHRADAKCAGCHAVMDPIGLALENFDSIGGYRTMDNGVPVNAQGSLLGVDFTGARELATLLARDARLQSCFTQQLLTYAVGRTFNTLSGRSYADALAKHAIAAGRSGVRELIETVVQSEAFRTRRGE